MSGFENQDMKLGRMMWELGRKAVELGLEETFRNTGDDDLIDKLEYYRSRKNMEQSLSRIPAGTRMALRPGAFLRQPGVA